MKGMRVVWFLLLAVIVAGVGCGKKAAPPPEVVTPTERPPVEEPPVVSEPEREPEAPPLTLRDVYFDYDKSDIRSDAKPILDANRESLNAHGGVRVVIEGHCDERGTVEYNLALGERRASAVYKYLTSRGVPADRLQTISYGEERPVDPGHDETAWAKNRRAHFVETEG
jgi:peptidoglycan-associated lipoprotein